MPTTTFKIKVVPHDSDWSNKFGEEAMHLIAALGKNVVAVHHIGSTSIPGIYAKPVIDILVEVKDIKAVDTDHPAMESLGYEVMGEFGIPGRRYFRKDDRKEIERIRSTPLRPDRTK